MEWLLNDRQSHNDEARDILRKIRARNLALMTSKVAEARTLNEEIWNYWNDVFPAWLKQKHYDRGLGLLLWRSANEIARGQRGQRFLKLGDHIERAPIPSKVF